MKVELGTPVVLRRDQPALWHIPKPTRRLLDHVEISIDDALERFAASWPAWCDEQPGDVFVYGGFVRQRRLCPGCAFLNKGATLTVPAGEAALAGEREAREDSATRRRAA